MTTIHYEAGYKCIIKCPLLINVANYAHLKIGGVTTGRDYSERS